jgi:hypothetical protein
MIHPTRLLVPYNTAFSLWMCYSRYFRIAIPCKRVSVSVFGISHVEMYDDVFDVVSGEGVLTMSRHSLSRE